MALTRRDLLLTLGAAASTLTVSAPGPSPARPVDVATGPRRVPADFFGMHIDNLAADLPDGHRQTPWVDIGERWLRLWDTYTSWKLVNPAPGRFDWHRLDAVVAIARAHRQRIVYNLGCAPDWATGLHTGGGQYSPGVPADAAWTAWVDALVERYRGRIDAYELWNEPNDAMFWTGGVDKLAHLCALAAPIIRSRDPCVTILSPCPHSAVGVPFLEGLIRAGVGRWCDAAACHPYVDVGEPEAMWPLIARFAAASRVDGVARPLWATEMGWIQYRDPTGALQLLADNKLMGAAQGASYVARAQLCAASSPLDRFFYYAADGAPVMKAPLVGAPGQGVLAAGRAHLYVARLLAGASIDQPEQRDGCYRLSGKTAAGRRFIAAWCGDGGTASLPVVSLRDATDALRVPVVAREGALSVSTMPVFAFLR